ncbi:hypothetical protein CONPUDRAFT_158547 [Coniophora puteana RWD-64-598 SS2]|uniref:Uncharacterized protein n=1 Tax=Coniophora puteana (strain RWD-64-598) TaxID=741705 RepID=A0A5M3MCF7_CONPW|nr:uncharacterized protein CONPUDRAFT_158547 [Coniophora puteana RWD-64-598 SS2]EIW76530.1 hypothetical protein CONPUDRAFT_158547 [Coniophora puteana RWD-64-598 SS2]
MVPSPGPLPFDDAGANDVILASTDAADVFNAAGADNGRCVRGAKGNMKGPQHYVRMQPRAGEATRNNVPPPSPSTPQCEVYSLRLAT